jgi:hypothetical protein
MAAWARGRWRRRLARRAPIALALIARPTWSAARRTRQVRLTREASRAHGADLLPASRPPSRVPAPRRSSWLLRRRPRGAQARLAGRRCGALRPARAEQWRCSGGLQPRAIGVVPEVCGVFLKPRDQR